MKGAVLRAGSSSMPRFRTYLWLLLFLGMRAGGNLSLAWGTKHFPQTLAGNPLVYLRSMLDPFVAGGIVMLILAMLAQLALLSVADLTFFLPLTSVGYVIAAVTGHFFLNEAVSFQRWLAVGLIFAGAVLVSRTPQNTTEAVETVPLEVSE
jgi:drug/metabolite transporter (DMT)-like permease